MSKIIVLSLVLMLTSLCVRADYFNTVRTEKIFGIFLTESAQIEEVHAHSNAFGFWPQTFEQITEYLNVNNNRLLPVMKINHFLMNGETGIYHDDVSGIIAAIEKSELHGRDILFSIDEPLWKVRIECLIRNKTAACDEVNNRYAQTLVTLNRAVQTLRQRFPGSGIIHLEAWIELALQKKASPGDNVIMLNDAEYVGFICYGAVHHCGSELESYRHQIEYGEWVWEAMMTLEANNPIGRKLMLVPGTFLAEDGFDNIKTLLEQIAFHAWAFQQSDKIGGFSAFLWGDMIEEGKYFTGARNIGAVANFLTLIPKLNGMQNLTLEQWKCLADPDTCNSLTRP